MIIEKYPVQVKGSASDTTLYVYRWEQSQSILMKERPMILLFPGGGYEHTSDREADPIAMQFFAIGYHVAILRYSVAPAEHPTALLEAFTSIKLIRENSKKWGVEEDKIYVQGCSAGGHLAASTGMFWNRKWIAETLDCPNEQCKPNGMILCYPVITAGEHAHRGSFVNLLGKQYSKELLELNSLEKQVSEDTPKAFIWHTYTDDAVPVENSLLLIQAMRKYNIPVEFHMYPVGGHGLATCGPLSVDANGYGEQKECASWLPLANTWLENMRLS